MKENQRRLPNMWQVAFVLGGFLALAFGFTSFGIDIQLALLIGWFLALIVGKMLGLTYKKMQTFIMEGITNGLEAVIILMIVGALVGTWISGGIVPSIIYYGLKIIHPSIFLVAALLISAITSIATGTSWGAAGTAGIAMMGIGAGLGVPAPITAGAVLSGCYFGDKVSPLSDSTVLSASMSGVDLIEHIKGMMYVSIPGVLVTIIAFLIAGFVIIDGSTDMTQVQTVTEGLAGVFNINLFAFIPMVIVIGLLAFGFPSIPVLSFGALLGIIWAILFQGVGPVNAISTAWAQIPMNTGIEFIDEILTRGGMDSMLGSVALIILGLGFGGLLDGVGILEVLTNSIDRFITGVGSLNFITILVGAFGNIFGSAMYVPLILTPKIMGAKYDEMDVDRRILSRNTEFGGTLISGMVPWSDNGIYMATILGVPTLQYLPFMWLSFACIAISIIYGYTNTFMFDDEESKAKNVVNN